MVPPLQRESFSSCLGLGEHPGRSQLRGLDVLFTGVVWQGQGQMCVGLYSSLGVAVCPA